MNNPEWSESDRPSENSEVSDTPEKTAPATRRTGTRKPERPRPSSVLADRFTEDIPVAQRDDEILEVVEPAAKSPRRFWLYWLWALLGLGLALGVGYLTHFYAPSIALSPSVSPALPSPALPSPSTTATISVPGASPTATPNTLLGHFAYPEAAPTNLRPIVSDGSVKLQAAAAVRFQEMVKAARREGVQLVPLSGFRSIAEQNYLFFDVKAKQGETARQRAEVSAPPGYSEHHTGYAVDLADGRRRDTDLQFTFETTPAFRWLQTNAARFSFEMSFPRNNSQGISYEPWHWRFVGDRASLETFYKARSTPAAVTPAPVTPAAVTQPPTAQP